MLQGEFDERPFEGLLESQGVPAALRQVVLYSLAILDVAQGAEESHSSSQPDAKSSESAAGTSGDSAPDISVQNIPRHPPPISLPVLTAHTGNGAVCFKDQIETEVIRSSMWESKTWCAFLQDLLWHKKIAGVKQALPKLSQLQPGESHPGRHWSD